VARLKRVSGAAKMALRRAADTSGGMSPLTAKVILSMMRQVRRVERGDQRAL
jgi:hypothetical protein